MVSVTSAWRIILAVICFVVVALCYELLTPGRQEVRQLRFPIVKKVNVEAVKKKLKSQEYDGESDLIDTEKRKDVRSKPLYPTKTIQLAPRVVSSVPTWMSSTVNAIVTPYSLKETIEIPIVNYQDADVLYFGEIGLGSPSKRFKVLSTRAPVICGCPMRRVITVMPA